jgi:hypothetical protein
MIVGSPLLIAFDASIMMSKVTIMGCKCWAMPSIISFTKIRAHVR